jgi:SAM-dependent methyltransferase
VTFSVSAAAYDRFMGRFSGPLSPVFAGWAGIGPGMLVLDVGCGPGALTAELVRIVGADRVAAVDPSETFVAACAERVPDADIRRSAAESLPFADGAFDAALAQLVLPFVQDAGAVALQMRRVVRPGGVVATCSWARDGMELLDVVWGAARDRLGIEGGESGMPYRTEEELRGLLAGAGLRDVETRLLEGRGAYDSFDDLWASLQGGAGPAGSFVAGLDDERRAALREGVRVRLGHPGGEFSLTGRAWGARGRVP